MRVSLPVRSRSRVGERRMRSETTKRWRMKTQKPALKAEATVRAGMVAVDLQQTEKGKPDKTMAEKALSLLQKGAPCGSRSLARGGGGRIASVAISVRSVRNGAGGIQTRPGADPEEVRAEMMLIVGNSQRQLGHTKEATRFTAKLLRSIRSGRKPRTRSISG